MLQFSYTSIQRIKKHNLKCKEFYKTRVSENLIGMALYIGQRRKHILI